MLRGYCTITPSRVLHAHSLAAYAVSTMASAASASANSTDQIVSAAGDPGTDVGAGAGAMQQDDAGSFACAGASRLPAIDIRTCIDHGSGGSTAMDMDMELPDMCQLPAIIVQAAAIHDGFALYSDGSAQDLLRRLKVALQLPNAAEGMPAKVIEIARRLYHADHAGSDVMRPATSHVLAHLLRHLKNSLTVPAAPVATTPARSSVLTHAATQLFGSSHGNAEQQLAMLKLKLDECIEECSSMRQPAKKRSPILFPAHTSLGLARMLK